jgi:hypothetical protein
MPLAVERVDTWAAAIEDRPGGLAAKLNALTGAGANLEFVIARRAAEKPGSGVLFVTPITGAVQTRVAREVGFEKSKSLHTVRVEGPNAPGHGLNIVEALAQQGLNLRGFTAAGIGRKFVAHLALDSAADAAKAIRVLRRLGQSR